MMVKSKIVVMIIKWPPGLTDCFFFQSCLLQQRDSLNAGVSFFFFFSCVCVKMGSWLQAFLAKTMETAL